MVNGLEVLGFVFGVFLIIEVIIPIISYYWTDYVNQSDSNKRSD